LRSRDRFVSIGEPPSHPKSYRLDDIGDDDS
jgi:hypothetical protein